MIRRPALFAILIAMITAGCAAVQPPAAPPLSAADQPASVAVKAEPPARAVSPAAPDTPDLALFSEGVALLKDRERAGTAKARETFAALVARYPQSRWRSAAEACLELLDAAETSRQEALKGKVLTEQLMTERGRLMQENEQLKKQVRELTERLQTEAGALSQENEKLRQDLQRLKSLEVELEKRDRMLR